MLVHKICCIHYPVPLKINVSLFEQLPLASSTSLILYPNLPRSPKSISCSCSIAYCFWYSWANQPIHFTRPLKVLRCNLQNRFIAYCPHCPLDLVCVHPNGVERSSLFYSDLSLVQQAIGEGLDQFKALHSAIGNTLQVCIRIVYCIYSILKILPSQTIP